MNDQILAELIAIRQLLERALPMQPAASLPTPPPASQTLIPQPSQLVGNPGAVCVHFGKNDGKPLWSLNDRSIEWYATPKEPRVGNNGKPFPPRPADEQLANAARQLYHQKRGTLANAAEIPAAVTAGVELDENVPF